MATADLGFFYVSGLVHLAVFQIQSFILCWSDELLYSWKIKCNILIKIM